MFIVPMSRQSPDLVRLFDGSFDRFFGQAAAAEGSRSPALDVAETETGYAVTLDLPGVAKEDVRVSVEGRRVTVQADAKREEERKEGARIVYRERTQASFARSFTLPAELDQAEAQAKLENGVLTLALPKRAARTASQIAIN